MGKFAESQGYSIQTNSKLGSNIAGFFVDARWN
jgi:hypothetical protein